MKHSEHNVLRNKNIAIVSTCLDDWGGSEDVWSMCIPYLQKEEFSISVLKERVNFKHKRIAQLKNENVTFIELKKNYNIIFKPFIRAYYSIIKHNYNTHFYSFENFLKRQKPQLIIISQAINFDGLQYGNLCLKHQIEFVIISQKAVEFYWPPESERGYMIDVFKNAKKCYFVSKHNRNLTEEQFGFRFKNSEIIGLPNKLKNHLIPYPSTKFGFKIALIGRLFIIDKGQDILFRILAKEKWKKRELQVSLIGLGPDNEGLKAMANLLELKNVAFLGFQDDIKQIWLNHHALVLPSRSEGMPLVILEAMAAGRTVIATKAGGTLELVEDGVTGFIGDATENSFEQALDQAWEKRHLWESIGIEASNFINKKEIINAEINFAKNIISLIYE
jgi:glycosyltransferase involved in cell wall biosynthesis